MSASRRVLSPVAVDAARVLGQQIARVRRARRWTAAELGERVGVTARTISAVEGGAPTVALGTYLEAATVLGVPLFGADGPGLAVLARRGRDELALLPRRVRHREVETEIDDDF